MARRPFDFRAILKTLISAKVDFIVVGGVSAVLNGAPISTFDLDIVHSRSADNIDRLQQALIELHAHFRFGPDSKRSPDKSHLASAGHQLLMTSSGPLDILGSLVENRSYEDLLPDTVEMEIETGFHVRVLKLEALVALKRILNQEKDRAVLPLLEATIRQRSKD